MLAASEAKPLYAGKIVKAKVISVSPTECTVGIDGSKHTGIVPLREMSHDPNAKMEDLVKEGDDLDLVVVKTNDQELFTGQAGMEELSGPIGTVSAVSQAVRYGWRDVLSLMALLTINVGIFNLLPIPALDGCKLLFLAWEGLTGHPVPDSVQGFVNTAGMVALVWLMVLVTLQDLTRFL